MNSLQGFQALNREGTGFKGDTGDLLSNLRNFLALKMRASNALLLSLIGLVLNGTSGGRSHGTAGPAFRACTPGAIV